MTDKVLTYMRQYSMLPENGNIVVGVSGGADSVCLLRVLAKLRESYDLHLRAVHINHGLRREAGEDADYVRSLCESWNVDFVLVEEDVEELAKREHLSCEEAGRKVRYEAFFQELSKMDRGKEGHGCIAVAHNRDDRAETLLFHLFRGTGLEGMGSIRPVRLSKDGSRIIRPLLFCSRNEIEEFLRAEGVAWRTDRTNAEDLYTRNKIRNRILPYVEKEICRDAAGHLAREAQLLSETAEFIGRCTKEALMRCSRQDPARESVRFDAAAFGREESFLQDQMIKEVMQRLGKGRDMTAAHVAEVKKLFAPSCLSEKRVELPVCEIRAVRQFGDVIVEKMTLQSKKDGQQDRANRTAGVRGAGLQNAAAERPAVSLAPGSFTVPGLGRIEVRLLPGPAAEGIKECENTVFLQNIPEKKYTKWFDYDKIIQSAEFRTRKSGDYLTINGALSQKSLKRYMIEEKIPAGERDSMPVLADGSHIMWVPGYRISAAYKVTVRTEKILEVCCVSGQEQR